MRGRPSSMVGQAAPGERNESLVGHSRLGGLGSGQQSAEGSSAAAIAMRGGYTEEPPCFCRRTALRAKDSVRTRPGERAKGGWLYAN